MKLSVRAGAVVSLVLFLALLTVSIVTGVSQQWFEAVHPIAEYSARLVSDAGPLRLLLALDDVFIVAYVLATLAVADRLVDGLGRRLVIIAVLLAGSLDLIENHHLLALVAAPHPGSIELSLQMVGSSCKWVLAHLAFVTLGLSLHPRTRLDRAFVLALVFVQLPLGVLVWTHPSPFFYWARALNLAVGFAWLSVRGDAVATATGAPA